MRDKGAVRLVAPCAIRAETSTRLAALARLNAIRGRRVRSTRLVDSFAIRVLPPDKSHAVAVPFLFFSIYLVSVPRALYLA